MRFLSAFAILLILGSAWAAVQVYYPVAAPTGGGATVPIGKIAPGHILKIITDGGPKSDPYYSVSIDRDWDYNYTVSQGRIYIYVKMPEEEGTKEFCISLSGEKSGDRFCPTVLIARGLVEEYVQKNVVTTEAGTEAEIPVLLKNTSSGRTTVSVSCKWIGECEGKEVELEAGDMKTVTVRARYPFPGTYDVDIIVTDEGSGDRIQEKAQIVLSPSTRNSMRLLRWGLPVLAPVLLPIYAITGLVG